MKDMKVQRFTWLEDRIKNKDIQTINTILMLCIFAGFINELTLWYPRILDMIKNLLTLELDETTKL